MKPNKPKSPDFKYFEDGTFICCPYCISTIEEDDTICPYCEKNTTQDALIEYNEDEFWRAEKKLCKNCENKIMAIAVICPKCKTKQ